MPDPIAVNSMFGRIASRYDLANRLLSFGIDRWWRMQLVGNVRKANPATILDLATGSGDVAFALSRGLPQTTLITGMDFCEPMLVEARKKQTAAHGSMGNIAFRQGDGLALPDPDQTYDAVTISFGLRNMADRHRSLTEMHRVLRPGGRLYVLEFSQPQRWCRALYYFYLGKVSPWLAGLVTGEPGAYRYLCDSITQFPDAAGLAGEIRRAGFSAVAVKRMTFGVVALHMATK